MLRYQNSRATFGFTLIELIVVIAIIGILTSIVLANLASARAGARDDIRKTDIKDLQVAVELYKAQNGRYPDQGCGSGAGGALPSWAGSESVYISGVIAGCPGVYIKNLLPDFIAVLPSEGGSTKTNQGYVYVTNSTGSEYKLMSHHNVEMKRITSNDDEFSRFPSSCTGVNINPIADAEKDSYAVYSSGAACW